MLADCHSTTAAGVKTTTCNGWGNIFLMLIIGNLLAALCIANLAWADLKTFTARRKKDALEN